MSFINLLLLILSYILGLWVGAGEPTMKEILHKFKDTIP